GEHVTWNYFEVLGIGMAAGRGFRPEEDRLEAPLPVAVVSHDLWQRAFGGEATAVGRAIRINGRSFTIIGVAPRGFRGVTLDWGELPDLWLPMAWFDEFHPTMLNRRLLAWREARSALVVGRLRPGVTREAAQAALRVRAAQLAAAYPEDRGWSVDLVSAREARFWPAYRRGVRSFLGLVAALAGALLLLACANMANLQLARGTARQREIAVRLALGATRRRILAEITTESAVISMLGLLGALGVARGLILLVSRFPLPFEVPLNLELALDRRALVFGLCV